MLDAYIQFLRNALCTVKNFNILGNTLLYDANVTTQYYILPSPLNETTPLEVLIAVTQFYAFIATSLAGYRMMTHAGIHKLNLLSRLANVRVDEATRNELKSREEDKTGAGGGNGVVVKKTKTTRAEEDATAVINEVASRLISQSIFITENDTATRSIFVGVNVFAVGIAFFWLFANSFHITSTGWMGGVAYLIHSLEVMELCLLVFLYYMGKDAMRAVRRSKQMTNFVTRINSSRTRSRRLSVEDVKSITVEEYDWLIGGWSPFWTNNSTTSSSSDISIETKLLTKEEEVVASNLTSFTRRIDDDVIDNILIRSRISLFEGYREYIYFILNFFAFYGYLVCILVYYYPNDEESSRPVYIQTMLGGMKNADADWLGNAVGDFMWTLEPIIILTSPMIIDTIKNTPTKSKEKLQ
jgi:hypothetical protein